MRVEFEEISIKGTRYWKDENGKRRQKTRTFYQTISPFNTNPDGTIKGRDQIMQELVERRDAFLRGEE